MSVKIRTIQEGKIGIIEVKGSLIGDKETDEFRAGVTDLIEQGNKSLVIDLKKVNYMNSSGIGAIIAVHSSYSKIGGVVKLSGLSNNVQSLFVATKLITIFDVLDSIDEAVEAFDKK